MKVAIAANKVGQELKDCVKAYLTKKGYEMVDLSDDDIFTATTNVVKAIQEQGITRGIVVDDYAVAPFIGVALSMLLCGERPGAAFFIALAVMAAGTYFASVDPA